MKAIRKTLLTFITVVWLSIYCGLANSNPFSEEITSNKQHIMTEDNQKLLFNKTIEALSDDSSDKFDQFFISEDDFKQLTNEYEVKENSKLKGNYQERSEKYLNSFKGLQGKLKQDGVNLNSGRMLNYDSESKFKLDNYEIYNCVFYFSGKEGTISLNFHVVHQLKDEVFSFMKPMSVHNIQVGDHHVFQNILESGDLYSHKAFMSKHSDLVSEENHLSEPILFFENDLTIEGSLELSELGFSIVVKGDLIVKGDINNYASDYGATLIVTGATHANNIIAGGAVIKLNDVYATGMVIGHYNDGMLMIGQFHKGVLHSNDHYTDAYLGKEAYSFTDSRVSNDNEFTLEDFGEIFKGEPFIVLENDGDEPYYYFGLDKFAQTEVNYENLVQKIKAFQKQKKSEQLKYENLDYSTFAEIAHPLNREVLDMRSSGYDLNEFLHDIGAKKSDTVKIIHHDLTVDENLSLNHAKIGADFLLIRGNLDVNGAIYSNTTEKVSALAVLGEVNSRNFAVANAYVFAKKGIKAEKTFFYTNPRKQEVELNFGLGGRIKAPIAILSGNISSYESLEKGTVGYTNTASINNTQDFEDLKPVLLPKFYSEKKAGFVKRETEIILESEKIITALVSGETIFDSDKLKEINVNESAFTKKWLQAFTLVKGFLEKQNVNVTFEKSESSYKLQIKGASFMDLPEKFNAKDLDINLTLWLVDSFATEKGKFYAKWLSTFEDFYQENFVNFFELLLKNKFEMKVLIDDSDPELISPFCVSLKDSKKKMVIKDMMADDDWDAFTKKTFLANNTFADLKTTFSTPEAEVDVLVKSIKVILAL